MKKWDGVTEFVCVADFGSFTKAAQHLGASIASISRQIAALENRLEAKLLYRTTRRVTLTDLGEIYFQHCRPLVDGLEEAERAITDIQLHLKGRLRITAPVAYGELKIVPALHDFMRIYPDLELDINLTNRRLDLISEGIDIAIRLGSLDDSTLMAKKLTYRQLITCASPDYLATYGEPHTVSELEQHNCLLGTLDYWRYREKDIERKIRVKGRLRCNNGPTLLRAALSGFGIVQLPDYYVTQPLLDQRLSAVLQNFEPEDEGIWALYPPNRHLSPKVRLVIDHLASKLGEIT